jgi:hypothetical protein
MSNLSDEIARLNLVSRVLIISGGVPSFILGTIGNLLNALAFAFHPQFSKLPSSIFLLMSFIGSQLDITSSYLPLIIYRITGTDPLVSSVIICKLRWFIGPAFGTVALHCICFAAINQYLITSRTARFRNLINRRRAGFISFIVLFYSIGVMAPSLFFYTHVVNSANATKCTIQNPIFATFSAYLAIFIYSLIPIFVLLIFSLLTWLNFRSNLVRQQGLERSLTRMLLTQIMMILVTSIPSAINQLYFFYTQTTQKSSLRIAAEGVLSSTINLVGFSTHCFSFYAYIFTSKTFRQNIQSFFFRIQRRIGPLVLTQHTNEQRGIPMQLQSRTVLT